MNAPSSLLVNPTLPDVNLQLERIRSGIAQAQGTDGETQLRELKKATQEFEAVFIGYMLKVMRSAVEPADEEGGALGKDIYLSMFDQEIALQMARNSSLGIGEMMYRQLEQTAKETKPVPGSSALEAPGLRVPANTTHPTHALPELTAPHHEKGAATETSMKAPTTWTAPVDGRLSSAFGERADPFTQASRFHRGVDIAAPGWDTYQGGPVTHRRFQRASRWLWQHDHCGACRRGHASRNLVREGVRISAEQVIGEVGSSGRSTGTHLHFELQKSGERLNPQEFLAAATGHVTD